MANVNAEDIAMGRIRLAEAHSEIQCMRSIILELCRGDDGLILKESPLYPIAEKLEAAANEVLGADKLLAPIATKMQKDSEAIDLPDIPEVEWDSGEMKA